MNRLDRFITKVEDLVRRRNEPQYSIRMITKGREKTYLPMVKEEGYFSKWTPIVKIYDEYLAMNYEKKDGLSRVECQDHIEKFKLQREKNIKENALSIVHIPMPSDLTKTAGI